MCLAVTSSGAASGFDGTFDAMAIVFCMQLKTNITFLKPRRTYSALSSVIQRKTGISGSLSLARSYWPLTDR